MTKEQFQEKILPFLKQYAEEEYLYLTAPEQDRKRKSWYASDFQKCPRGLYYDRLGGYTKKQLPEFVKNVGHEGKMKELEIIVKHILNGTEILSTQERLYDDQLDVSGRPDMVIKENGTVLVEEVKTKSSRAFWYNVYQDENGMKQFRPYPHEVGQLTYYIEKMNKKYEGIQGRLRYKSRDDGTEMLVPITFDQYKWQEFFLFFQNLNNCWKEKVLPQPTESILFNPQTNKFELNFQASYCDYHHLCMNDMNWESKAKKEAYLKNVSTR